MSELRSAIEVLQAEDVGAVSDEQLEADFTELERAARTLEAERLRRLSEIHRRQSHRREGYLSTASWLVDRHRLGWTAASKEIRTARSLERMPHTRDALATGELTSSAVQMLIWARQAHPAQFHKAERSLVEAARRLPAGQLQHAVSHWRQRLDWEQGLKEAERLRQQRRLTVSTTMLGMVRVDGNLDPETGETMLAALRNCVDAGRRHKDPDDQRTPTQRRVDALGEICHRWLNAPTGRSWRASVLTSPSSWIWRHSKDRPGGAVSSITLGPSIPRSCGGWPAMPQSAGSSLRASPSLSKSAAG